MMTRMHDYFCTFFTTVKTTLLSAGLTVGELAFARKMAPLAATCCKSGAAGCCFGYLGVTMKSPRCHYNHLCTKTTSPESRHNYFCSSYTENDIELKLSMPSQKGACTRS
jgi:hypothetical protein